MATGRTRQATIEENSVSYERFLAGKTHLGGMSGFDPVWMPEFLFDFQKALVEWAVRKGRAAIFADCGLGKTPMQLVWAENVVRHTNKPVLIAAPLAVSYQILREAEKEADVILWDGGNNDLPFYRPDLHIVLADPLRPGDEAGAVRKDGLVAVTVKGKTYLAHRLIWFLVKGEWPEGRLTFHDKDPQNLRWHNIRPESDFFSPTAAAAYLRQHRQKRREAINRGDLDAER